jgi:hypothetical protein
MNEENKEDIADKEEYWHHYNIFNIKLNYLFKLLFFKISEE